MTRARRPASDVEATELERLRRSAIVAETIAAAAPDAIVCCDTAGLITYWNPAAERLFGYPRDEAIGQSIDIIVPPKMRGNHGASFARVLGGEEARLIGQVVELPAVDSDGNPLEIELSLVAWRNAEGLPEGFAAIVRDASRRKQLERERAEAQRFLDSIVEHLPAMLFVKDAGDFRYLLWNEGAEQFTGRKREEVVGCTDIELFPSVGQSYRRRDRQVLRTGRAQRYESHFPRQDGTTAALRTTRVLIPDEEGNPRYILGMTEDVTEWRLAQDRLAFLVGHDPLTHLRSRAGFAECLDKALQSAVGEAAVMKLDLDRFKAINEEFGVNAGDMLLVQFAKLLIANSDAEVLGRLGGNEFGLLFEGPGAAARATRAARAITAALAEPLVIEDGARIDVSASIGVAVAPADGRTTQELLRAALLALGQAKSERRGSLRYFEAGMDDEARARRRLEKRLRQALADGGIVPWFQPIADLETGRITGFEALARWHDEELGEVPPDSFIPIAEDAGLISEVGAHMLRATATEAAGWSDPLTISVNVSPHQVHRPGFAQEVAAILGETGLDPKRLELEVTEGVLLEDADHAIATLRALHDLGVAVVMDDFGTGYSSLSYFNLFHFDKIKIDQCFVRHMHDSREASAIIAAVTGLARELNLPVVAEGIESADQLAALREKGCTHAQGFHVGKPAPAEAFVGTVLKRLPAAQRASRVA